MRLDVNDFVAGHLARAARRGESSAGAAIDPRAEATDS